MKRISYILPCYNVELYVADCLDSIYAQPLPLDDFEVICVDDSSTDGTLPVLERYATRYGNMRIIRHMTNRTAGGARNTGIDAANGERIWFVDPDDVLKAGVVAKLLEQMPSDVDVLLFNYDVVNEDLSLRTEDMEMKSVAGMPGVDFVENFFPGGLSRLGIVWRCLFSRDFLVYTGLRFPLIKKSQDVVFMWKALAASRKVVSVEDVGYANRLNPGSIVNQRRRAEVAFAERILFGSEVLKWRAELPRALPRLMDEDLMRCVRWCANDNSSLLDLMTLRERVRYYRLMNTHRESVQVLRPYMSRRNRLLFTIRPLIVWLLTERMRRLRRGQRSSQ